MIIDPYQWHSVRITGIFHDAPDAVTILTERPPDYTFAPGQHAIIRVTLPDGTKRLRQYSYASNPESSSLQFTITRSPDGDVSSWFIDTCATTSKLEISQAFTGPLHINTDSYVHVGMVAGGSGIAPMLSHLDTMRKNADSPQRTLLYSTRASSRCAVNFLQETENETIVVKVTDSKGRFSQDEIIRGLGDCDLILLCGSRQFVRALRDICTTALPDVEVRAEAFSLT